MSVIHDEKPASNGDSRHGSSPAGLAHSPTGPGTALTPSSSVPSVDEARLLRKIDFHVLPSLFVVYVVAFLDRVNMSNALTLGLPEELGLTGQQPNISLTIFFVPYILFEIPSNILMKKLSPHMWLSGSIFLAMSALCFAACAGYAGIVWGERKPGTADTRGKDDARRELYL